MSRAQLWKIWSFDERETKGRLWLTSLNLLFPFLISTSAHYGITEEEKRENSVPKI